MPSDRYAGHPLLRILSAFPIVCFTGALATDIAYAATVNIMWADFSAWLLAAGMALGALAAVVGCLALFTRRRIRLQRPGLLALGSIMVLALALLDNFVHSRDAWTSVVPGGLALSALTVIVMLVTVWLGTATLIGDTRTTDPRLQEPRA